MTCPRCIGVDAEIVIALTVAAVLLTLYVVVPLVDETALVSFELGPAGRESFWQSVMMLVRWLVAVLACCWATLARGRLLGRPGWPAWALSVAGLCVIAATFAAGAVLGGLTGQFEKSEPTPDKAFAWVEGIMRDFDHFEAYLLNMIMEIAMAVCLGMVVLALLWSLTLLGRDPGPIEEQFS